MNAAYSFHSPQLLNWIHKKTKPFFCFVCKKANQILYNHVNIKILWDCLDATLLTN
jgi:hypothetical protein